MDKQVELNFHPGEAQELLLAIHLRIELTLAYLFGPSVFVILLI